MDSSLTLVAPAKLNLTLEVLGKRPDGFHEIRSVFQTINLCDSFSFSPAQEIRFECNLPEWSAEKSLVTGAVRLLKEATGCKQGAIITLNKRIPLVSGLGGDSSDAAVVLRGLNRLWGLRLSQEKLLELAASLGSDTNFFLWGNTALGEGRGEIVTPLPALGKKWVVLVVPNIARVPGKTGELYNRLKPAHYTDGHITRQMVEVLRSGRNVSSSMLFNTFENVAFDYYPGLATYKEHMVKLGAPYVHLAGSGPVLFTLYEDKAPADDLLVRYQNQGLKAYRVRTGLPEKR